MKQEKQQPNWYRLSNREMLTAAAFVCAMYESGDILSLVVFLHGLAELYPTTGHLFSLLFRTGLRQDFRDSYMKILPEYPIRIVGKGWVGKGKKK